LTGLGPGEAQGAVELGVVETEERPVAPVAFDRLAQAVAFTGVKGVEASPGDRQRGVVRQP